MEVSNSLTKNRTIWEDPRSMEVYRWEMVGKTWKLHEEMPIPSRTYGHAFAIYTTHTYTYYIILSLSYTLHPRDGIQLLFT